MTLPSSTLEKVKVKLGLADRMNADLDGLTTIYKSWSQSVGYDNVNLIRYLRGGSEGSVPGLPAEDYFASWLEYDLANFCWANSEALRTILASYGFETVRIVGSMGTWRKLPVTFVLPHGSLMAIIEGQGFLVDPTFLIEEPLPIVEGEDTCAGTGSLQVWSYANGKIRWQLPQSRFDASFEIRNTDADLSEFQFEHQKTINGLHDGRLYRDKLYIRRNVNGGTVTLDQGHIIRRDGKKLTIEKLDKEAPVEAVKQIFGLSDDALYGLPVDAYY